MPASALKRTRIGVVRSRPVYPDYIAPALATNIGRPPTGDGWVHEIKYDGFRTQIHFREGQITAYSRGGNDWTERYTSVVAEAAKIEAKHAVLDGEMVVLRDDGTCDFWQLQRDVRGGFSDRLTYFAFDILFYDGEDVRRLPFLERKALLKQILGKCAGSRIRYVEHLDADGAIVWAHAHKINVEGIISKRIQSPYRSIRGEDWIKTPCQYREELLVAGMAFDGEAFGGLYLARRNAGKLLYAGKVEDGFSEEAVSTVRARLDPLITRQQPVVTVTPKPDAKWVEPSVKVRLVHRGGLSAERVRRAVFEALVEPPPRKRKATARTGVPRENIMRELMDAEVPSKAQLRSHWRKVARRALPHLAGRPLTLVRHVDGVTFYHMGPLPPVPTAVHQLEIRKANGSRGVRLWVDDLEGLLGLVEIGVVEVHPWAATVDDIEHPDHLIFDLDPGEGIEWPFVVETAMALRDLLADEGFDCWPKLTGGSGIHLMAPIDRDLTHDQVHRYAVELAERIRARNPAKYTTTAGPSRRIGRLFIDHLRNGRGFTAVGAFSPRARPGLPIAIPTTWEEVEGGILPSAFTLGARLAKGHSR